MNDNSFVPIGINQLLQFYTLKLNSFVKSTQTIDYDCLSHVP